MTQETGKLLALDVDQTLAGGLVVAHLRFYNKELNLGMTESEIQEAGKLYRKTFDVPQIIAYRAQDEAGFQQARDRVRSSDQVNLDLELIPGTREAVNFMLSTFLQVGYFTVRPPETLSATQLWLSQKDMPHPEQVIICDDHEDKIIKVLAALKSANNTAILVDDSLAELLQAVRMLVEKGEYTREQMGRITFVGFGISDLQKQAQFSQQGAELGVQVFCLPSWQASVVTELMENITE